MTKLLKTESTWTHVKTDWFQQASQNNARFCIEKKRSSTDSASLWLFRVAVDQKPILHPMAMQLPDYYEGLWEYDVAEWFIVNPETGKYIELNLAPSGAWWMMVFDAPRQRALQEKIDIKQITTDAVCTPTSWSAQLSLPEAVLEQVLGKGELKHNVCFILGQNPREYLSWTVLKAQQPDFHRPVDFISILKA